MKLCCVTAAHNIYTEDIHTGNLKLCEKICIYIDQKSTKENDYGLKFCVNPENVLVHPDYITLNGIKKKDIALIELN